MAATSASEPEALSPTGQRPLDLLGPSELDLAELLTCEATEAHETLDRFARQMLEGAQIVRSWFWTVVLVALALFVVGFFTHSP